MDSSEEQKQRMLFDAPAASQPVLILAHVFWESLVAGTDGVRNVAIN